MKLEETAAKAITDAVNSMGFDDNMFCEAMAREHRTLQQSFTRLCLAWLKHCATDTYGKNTDARNEAAHRIAKELVEARPDLFDGALPFI